MKSPVSGVYPPRRGGESIRAPSCSFMDINPCPFALLRLPVAPPHNSKFFFPHFRKKTPNPVAPPSKKSRNSRNTTGYREARVLAQCEAAMATDGGL